MMLWQAWQQDYGVSTQHQTPTTRQQKDIEIPSLPSEEKKNVDETPDIIPATGTPLTDSRDIRIATDVLNITIDQGGNINFAELPAYPQSLDKPGIPVNILYEGETGDYLIQGGLSGDNSSPSHQALYSTKKDFYQLEQDQNELIVPLEWVSEDGVSVIKSYKFYRGSYRIDVNYQVRNESTQQWKGRAYGQIVRTDPGSSRTRMIYTYNGAVISRPDKRYEKIDYDDTRDEKLSLNITDGWVAMLQHYFISAIIPADKNTEHYFYTSLLDKNRYAIGMATPAVTIPSGETATLNYVLYIGPKIQEQMARLAEGLELTVDYGVLWFIAKPLYWCLEAFHSVSGNWGWSIVLVTLLLKILFYKLSAAGYKSMANMRRVQPRLMAIKERYKNDRTKLNQAMMDIYKKEKINPLGGCFPIVIQIPVFIALYWVLLESVELRQTPFILWIKDLSSPDPYFVLPLVMGVTMIIQQKLNPAPMDPVQEKVMMVLPIVFTVFFAFFPSGLVLYWVVNNILSIIQQWMITRKIEGAGVKQ